MDTTPPQIYFLSPKNLNILNIVDVMQIVNQILHPSIDILNATETYVADINLDGVLNVFDIIIIINIILG